MQKEDVDDVASLPVSKLKEILAYRGIDYSKAVEKSELVALVKESGGIPRVKIKFNLISCLLRVKTILCSLMLVVPHRVRSRLVHHLHRYVFYGAYFFNCFTS
jgi:hypothetical protein